MPYQLDCECGDGVSVEETAAGTTARCRCGRTIVVPSLRELRRRAGLAEPGLAPDKAVETLLLAGKLPAEDCCVLCGVATDACVYCYTECERAYVEAPGASWAAYVLGFVTFGWLGVAVAHATAGEGREVGKDRVFSLPLRVCDTCRQSLTSPAEVKAALCRVPLYRRLFTKYPGATASLLP